MNRRSLLAVGLLARCRRRAPRRPSRPTWSSTAAHGGGIVAAVSAARAAVIGPEDPPPGIEAATELSVAADFPGGSARVESIDQVSRTIRLVPAEHPGRGWACWWSLRVDGIRPGETIALDVGGGHFARPDRTTVSLDQQTWSHTAPGERRGDRIVYRQRVDAARAWFAWGTPFTLADAAALVERAARAGPHASAFELCRSREGHPVPALRIGRAEVPEAGRLAVWVQARQHAWESGSSWVARGLVEWLVSDDPRAARLREAATVVIVPIMDVDNVRRGAGGKDQPPHDHNRDWSDAPHWPEVRAAIEQLTALDAAGRLALFVDLHNPAPGDREPFFYVPPKELMTARGREAQRAFLEAAAAEIRGPLRFRGETRASDAAYDPGWARISGNWVKAHLREPVVAVCLETPWNMPASTAENYLQVGRELGLAIERYLQEPDGPGRP